MRTNQVLSAYLIGAFFIISGIVVIEKDKQKNKEENMKTVIEYGEFKGAKTMQIWEVDNDGQKKGDYPIISFGKKKAQALVENADEIAEFAESSK